LPATHTITINPTPAINAGPDKFIRLGTSTTLDATINNPANYNFLWTPSLYLSAADILNPVSAPDNLITYTITCFLPKRMTKPELLLVTISPWFPYDTIQ